MKRAFSFPRSIGTKLYLLLSIMVVLMLAIVGVSIGLFSQQIEDTVRNHAFQVGDVLKRATYQCMLENDREHLRSIVENIGKEPGIDAIRIYNSHGEEKISADMSTVGRVLSTRDVECAYCHATSPPRGTIPPDSRIRLVRANDGARALGVINPIMNTSGCSGQTCHAHSPDQKLLGVIDITMSLRNADISARTTRLTVLGVSVALIVVTALLFRGFVRIVVQRPITRLIDGTERVASLDLDYEIPVKSEDELGYLSSSFNQMTTKLREAHEANRHWAETLEDRVQQKTGELKRAHAHFTLVEKMTSLGKLAGVVAHEINNPIAGILGCAKVCIRSLSNSPTTDQIQESIQDLSVIRDEAKRCGDIVNQLLVFSRRSRGEASEQDLNQITQRAIQLAQHGTKATNVALTSAIETDNVLFYCDPAAMQQMLLIFIMNAVEAMPAEGGEVEVRLRRKDDGQTVIFEIRDTGVGIAPSDLPRIFEPYYTTKDSAESTGLGLAVAYRIIVDQHQGTISVDSKLGRGTKFTIELRDKRSVKHLQSDPNLKEGDGRRE
jgi:two-component system NtrC family sensor kinase